MKFLNLLKKELRELINAQMIAGLVVMLVLLLSLGNIMSGVMEESTSETGTVNISDMDNSQLSQKIISSLESSGLTVNLVSVQGEDKVKLLEETDCDSLIIIPEGFENDALGDYEAGNNEKIEVIKRMKTSSSIATMTDKSSVVVEIINNIIKNELMVKYGFGEEDILNINTPVTVSDYTVVNDKYENINSNVLVSVIQSQSMFVPLVVFVLVMLTSQMIISAISTEKIDKTLETLLSAPVSRMSVLGAKMLAAGIVAILNAVVYMIGFYGYMGKMLEGSIDSEAIGSALTINEIMSNLGLKMGISGFILVGIQMFLTIMICLAVSLILGALVNDAKSAQTMLMPIMVLAMIPYMVSMIYDINMLSPVVRTLIYAIPFTHTFNAMNNVMFGNMQLYWFGFAYQLVLFGVCMFFAVKIFTSDKIFTISLNFGQKKKFKMKK